MGNWREKRERRKQKTCKKLEMKNQMPPPSLQKLFCLFYESVSFAEDLQCFFVYLLL